MQSRFQIVYNQWEEIQVRRLKMYLKKNNKKWNKYTRSLILPPERQPTADYTNKFLFFFFSFLSELL